MKKMKRLFALLLAVSMIAALASCGGSGGSSEGDTGAASADGAQELNIYMWQQYISDDLIANFEKENNCKVNLSYMSDNADAITKLTAGGA